jgi:hypothetical protein
MMAARCHDAGCPALGLARQEAIHCGGEGKVASSALTQAGGAQEAWRQAACVAAVMPCLFDSKIRVKTSILLVAAAAALGTAVWASRCLLRATLHTPPPLPPSPSGGGACCRVLRKLGKGLRRDAAGI